MAIDFSSPLLLRARDLARKSGLLGPLKHLVARIGGGGYEAKFVHALMGEIGAGDRVWDVGANVGFYTRQFADLVGPAGAVVAFEPAPDTFATLRRNTAHCGNVRCEPLALSNAIGEADFFVGAEANSPLSGLARRSFVPAARTVPVKITTGDAFLAANPGLAPNAVKIDVEGFEYEVVKGMGAVLRARALRALFIELHFTSLAERGLADAPREIAQTLKTAGFALRWTDASHLVATRPPRAS